MHCCRAFKDHRYIKIDGKLAFSVFAPKLIPSFPDYVQTWQSLAAKEGLPGFHFIGMGIADADLSTYQLDAGTPHLPHHYINQMPITLPNKISYRLFKKNLTELQADVFKKPRIFRYADIVEVANRQTFTDREYPVAVPNWDHSPRSGKRAFVLHGSTPALFSRMLRHCIQAVSQRPYSRRVIFLKAWNEWAEGNFLEPEAKFGRGYLEAVKKENIES